MQTERHSRREMTYQMNESECASNAPHDSTDRSRCATIEGAVEVDERRRNVADAERERDQG